LNPWNAFHLFCHANAATYDQFITESIDPLVQRLKREQRISGWFFIRYWEGGPHIRLRLRDASAETLSAARGELHAALSKIPAFLEVDVESHYAHFSARRDAESHYGWHPHGTVEAFEYEPEIHRYGGERAMPLGEAFFEASSQVAITLIRASQQPEPRLAGTLTLLFGLLRASSIAHPAYWLSYHAQHYVKLDLLTQEFVSDCRASAHADFAQQATRYDQFASRTNGFWGMWERTVQQYAQALRAIERDGALSMPTEGVLHSQWHMLCNRLAFGYEAECYLTWLAEAYFLAKTAPRPDSSPLPQVHPQAA
jgi:hypothetical protein